MGTNEETKAQPGGTGEAVIRVALVEDDGDVRESICKYVNAAPGFKCTFACESGEEALKLLPEDPPDVVLMDINMEGMNGIECVRRLKSLLANSQVVMLTVFEDPEMIFSALAAGASGYLLKRMPPGQLLDAIREVRNGGAPMSASIARKVVQSFQASRVSNNEAELSPRERQVLNGLAEGRVYKQIADEMGVSIHTLRNYIRRIYEKLHVHTRTQAVAKFFRQ